ncbi:MAG: response regulator [Chloroflexi bacterium]|nr:response regulator [Chloroflexota bacterium]
MATPWRRGAHGGEFARAREALPDAILLDLDLPWMHGPELWRAPRVLPGGRDAKLILLTADQPGGRAAVSLGAHGGLMKPFGIDQLLATLEQVTRAGRSELS